MRLLAALAAALAIAPAALAGNGSLVVDPGYPLVGKRATIEVHAQLRGPAYLRLVSPTGVRSNLRLTRVARATFRAGFHFPDDGRWKLQVLRTRVTGSVLVFQSPGALPPWRGNKASPLSGLVGPGIVIGR